jgi:hypothetical protein
MANETENEPNIDPRLIRLRVELFTALQTLKDADLQYFNETIGDIVRARNIAAGVAIDESSVAPRSYGGLIVDMRRKLLERAEELLAKGIDDGAAKLVTAYASIK